MPGKRPIAVLHFENRSGDRELDWLREGLADMLITNLSRSKSLSVLSRQQLYLLLERIGRESATKLRLDEAQEIARRARAEAVVMGSFARLGGQTRIEEYERLLRLNPNWAWSQFRLGEAYQRKGDGERAQAAYRRLLEIWKDADPDIPEVIEAKARLANPH